MAAETPRYAPMTNDTGRQHSMNVWKDCPLASIAQDPSLGMYFYDDFRMAGQISAASAIQKGSLGQWSVYGAVGSLISDGALEGGVLSVTSGTNLDQTVFFSSAGSYRLMTASTLALNQELWFEARVARSSVAASVAEMFVGLADKQLSSSLPYVNSLFSGTDDVLSTVPNLIGFYSTGETGYTDWRFVYQLAGGTAVYSAGLQTLVVTALGAALAANQFVKLGFVFNPQALLGQVTVAGDLQTFGSMRKKILRIFVNGVELPTFLSQDNFVATPAHAMPTGFMSPTFGIEQHATKGSLLIDSIECCQMANS